ncbi:uncharacterized protein CMU_017120 [Cryptosporidium muris RN66]|uniref:Uncharacterized protein n=1 Tax=Cryptosporidium muris (strain RN66) TaxID=441375 RepID=B6ACV6_CRYMR|nr:uncharacterized protein CMU_017120 [Cryptosporidium muris RN66]EEA05960.1 hypothetical protein, conserved [Cryptosporidium muris RN66]|eukprot:XP_002140309.1 hypothetical protein [Cryptosporidium muris RN66]
MEKVKLAVKKQSEYPISDIAIVKDIKTMKQASPVSPKVLDQKVLPKQPSMYRTFQDGDEPPLPNYSSAEEQWPHIKNISDIGNTITDLKTNLLKYYRTLYIPAESSIESKIEALRSYRQSKEYISTNKYHKNILSNITVTTDSRGLDIFHRPREAPLLDDLPGPSDPIPPTVFSNRDKMGRPKPGLTPVDKEDFLDFHGLAQTPNMQKLRIETSSINKGEKSAGILDGNFNIKENLIGLDLKDLATVNNIHKGRLPFNQMGEMLDCISKSCQDVQNRLNNVEDSLSILQDNPKTASFVPPISNSRRLINNYKANDPVACYIYTLYRDLYNRSAINAKRIEVIKSKIKVLQAHAKPNMLRIISHPSLGMPNT